MKQACFSPDFDETVLRLDQDQHPLSSANGESSVIFDEIGRRSISEVFSRTAIKYPQRRAIGASKWQPNFEALESVSNRIANGILAHGGNVGDRVAVLMEHDAPLLAVILGILKTGRLVLVLNLGTPMTRLKEVMADASPRLLIMDEANAADTAALAESGCTTVAVKLLVEFDDPRNPGFPIDPSTPAFLIYTSGSTGRPKGVVQNHRNILHTVEGYTRRLGYQTGDRFCLLGSLSGGQGVMTAFSALLNGATVYPYSLRQRGLNEMSNWMVRHKISVLVVAASIFRQFIRSMPAGMTFPSLRLVRLGAERARLSDLAACRKIAPAMCRFANVLSSSEAGNLAIFQCGLRDHFEEAELPVGYPNAGKTIMIWDAQSREVDAGMAGEIVVRSRFLSPGYWNDSKATLAAFDELPESELGERLYRTGDLGRWRSDGQLEHLGRRDRQNKVLGNRVDLNEVELALEAQPGVVESLVMMHKKIMEQEADVLEACVVLQEGVVFEESWIRERLRELLPSHAVPTRIVRVGQILRTANGKVDETAMVAAMAALNKDKGVDEARTEMERRVAAIWREALKRPTLGIHEPFFESAGDSLQAVDLLLSLSKAFNQHIDASALVNHPTIAQFAEALETGRLGGKREAWFRLPKASLLDLRHGGDERPVLFLPGGYTGENELMVFAKLATLLGKRHPIDGVRLNLHALRVLRTFSLYSLARQAGRAYLGKHGARVPLIVGECRAAILACITADWLSRKLKQAPPMILLDPWHPRTRPSNEGSHPPGIEKYYRLLSEATPRAYAGEVHLVCAADSDRGEVCRAWWSARLGEPCRSHQVPGNHTSYLREHREELSAVLNEILRGVS